MSRYVSEIEQSSLDVTYGKTSNSVDLATEPDVDPEDTDAFLPERGPCNLKTLLTLGVIML